MSARPASRWVVVKFGGTSVSSLANWQNIALVVKRRLEAGNRVLVVHSAVSKITDGLEKLLASAIEGKPVVDTTSLLNTVAALKPGSQAALTLLRERSEVKVKVTVGRRPIPAPLP